MDTAVKVDVLMPFGSKEELARRLALSLLETTFCCFDLGLVLHYDCLTPIFHITVHEICQFIWVFEHGVILSFYNSSQELTGVKPIHFKH